MAIALPLSRVLDALRDAGLVQSTQGASAVTVTGASQDSRTTRPGDLFLAWAGIDHDAHDFLGQARARGAVAAVVERTMPGLDLPCIVVRDGRLAGAIAADVVCGSPWTRLLTVGVTGTNGKTTTAVLARHLLSGEGASAAIGTLGLVDATGEVRPGTEGLTTPGPVQLSSWLGQLTHEGVERVVMEASSHALEQRRLDGIRFDVAVFTNMSQDHLDYHARWEEYFASKARLIELLKPDGSVVINAGDPAWQDLPDGGARRIYWGFGEGADVRAGAVELGDAGARFALEFEGKRARVELPLMGHFNVENALAAAAVAIAAGMSLQAIAAGLAGAPQVPGRVEVVVREPFLVIIDFAHTPAALHRVIEALRPMARGRLIVVFGAGGDRDRTKRPAMGAAVADGADVSVVTSDNPRTENAETIIDDIVQGMKGATFQRIADRREAIHAALGQARRGDLVLLAGKGHERYQVVGTESRPFDEREVVEEFFGSDRAA